jgi:hypothetical protein
LPYPKLCQNVKYLTSIQFSKLPVIMAAKRDKLTY